MPLTDDAKAELQSAIRIVREDKFESHARGILSKYTKPAEKEVEKDPLITEKEKDVVDPPPKKEGEKEIEEPPKRHSAYWGEIMD